MTAARPEPPAAGGLLERLGRRLLVPTLLALLALVALALVADARRLAAALSGFDYRLLAPVLALSLANYALRFWRWQLYLACLEVRLAPRLSLAVFLVGFLLSVTPGKAGELGKAWLARELGGGEARRTVAAVLAERVTDLIAMVLLTGLGALAFEGGLWLALGAAALSAVALAALGWRWAAERLLGFAHRLPLVRRRADVLAEVYDLFRKLLAPAPLAAAMALSLAAWAAEAIGFVLVARSYEAATGWLAGLFIYCASVLAGAISLLPGGLLASEGALTALLNLQGMETPEAASATLIIRGATLWFAVALGLAAVPFVLRALRAREAARRPVP